MAAGRSVVRSVMQHRVLEHAEGAPTTAAAAPDPNSAKANFSFPFEPYEIQERFMEHLYRRAPARPPAARTRPPERASPARPPAR